MTSTKRLREDCDIGPFDNAPFKVARRYRGDLSEDDRKRLLASSVRFLIDCVTYDSAGAPKCDGTDCTPADHDVIATYRREMSDLLYQSLNAGLIPSDIAKLARAIGREVGIARHEIEALVDDLHALIQRFEWASGIMSTGGSFIFDQSDEDDENMPQYVVLREIVIPT